MQFYQEAHLSVYCEQQLREAVLDCLLGWPMGPRMDPKNLVVLWEWAAKVPAETEGLLAWQQYVPLLVFGVLRCIILGAVVILI